MSKELQALSEIIDLIDDKTYFSKKGPENYEIIETAIEALEIIEERLNFNFDDETKSISITRNNGFMHITLFFDKQEEFDLLKEVLL